MGVVGDVGGDHGAVGQLHQLVVRGEDLGIEQANLLYRPLAAAGGDIVPGLEGVGDQQLKAAGHVVEKILDAQGDGQASHRQHRHQGRHRDAQAAHDHQQRQKQQQSLYCGAQHSQQRSVHMGVGQYPVHPFQQQLHRQQAYHGHQCRRQQAAQAEAAQFKAQYLFQSIYHFHRLILSVK